MMNDLISRQAVLDIVDDLRDRMTVEGYCAMIERVKAVPSATCGNLEKPEIPQHSEGEAADCNLDCISRQMLLEYIHGEPVGKLLCDKYNLDGLIEQFPSVQPEQTNSWCINSWCNDCKDDVISRAEAIRVASGYCHPANIAKELAKLPSAQPERKTGRWIPCSERLPKKDGDYIVTFEKGYASDYGLDPIGIAPFEVDCEGFGFWQEQFDMHTLGSLGSDWVDINVIAWKPLPEPYKEGGVV